VPGPQRIIKKYANRKLYDMQDRKYVTQKLVQAMVDAGDNVVVIDKDTDADITDTVVRRSAAAAPKVRSAAPKAAPEAAAPVETPTSHSTTHRPVAANTVRDQFASLVRASITLPLEIGQIARDRLQSADKGASAVEIERLNARVAELEAEMAVLRDVLTSDDIKLVRN